MNITLEKICKMYNNSPILDIDELKFDEGKIYVILGSNGSGKSTLLNCIVNLNTLTGGNIFYNGNSFNNSIKNEISIMEQKPYLFNTTSYENIISGLKFRKISSSEIKMRVEKYLDYFYVEPLLNKKSKWLSGGERAKIALLRTAVLETEVTLLDEPTASMDIESSMKAEKLVMDMSNGKRTVILVTHDVYQAKRIADYVIFMDKGKVIEMGDKNSVLVNPKSKLLKQVLNI